MKTSQGPDNGKHSTNTCGRREKWLWVRRAKIRAKPAKRPSIEWNANEMWWRKARMKIVPNCMFVLGIRKFWLVFLPSFSSEWNRQKVFQLFLSPFEIHCSKCSGQTSRVIDVLQNGNIYGIPSQCEWIETSFNNSSNESANKTPYREILFN